MEGPNSKLSNKLLFRNATANGTLHLPLSKLSAPRVTPPEQMERYFLGREIQKVIIDQHQARENTDPAGTCTITCRYNKKVSASNKIPLVLSSILALHLSHFFSTETAFIGRTMRWLLHS